MTDETNPDLRAPACSWWLPVRMYRYFEYSLFTVFILSLVLGIALPAWGQEASPELRKAIELAKADDIDRALPGLIAASAAGERIANYWIGVLLLNRKRINDQLRSQDKQFADADSKFRLEARIGLEAVRLRELIDFVGRIHLTESLPELTRRSDAGDVDVMVNLALAYSVLDEKEEKVGLFGSRSLTWLERAANGGSGRATTLLWSHYASDCVFPGSTKCQQDKVYKYGCILVRMNDQNVAKFMARRFPDKPCK